MQQPVYLDFNATTPVDKRVLEAMLPYFSEKFGNAASKTHSFGWVAEEAVANATSKVASLLACEEQEIVYTSGATEGVNTILKGVAELYKDKGKHIVTTVTEHKAVLDTCKYLETKGFSVTYLPVNFEGLIDLDQLRTSITPETVLVSVMFANNETGVIQPVKAIADIVHERGSIFFSDATQAIGKVEVNVNDTGIDALVISGHKLYGPKGVGAMYLRRKKPRVSLEPLIHGGGHQHGFRSGTLNVPGIVGLGKACEIAQQSIWEDAMNTSTLRTRLEQLIEQIGGVRINGSIKYRLPNTTNISFEGLGKNSLVKHLANLAVATGSACTSANPEPSHVLKAMGITDEMAYNSVRFSLGRYTTIEEIDFAVEEVRKVLNQLRSK